jgi:hypothetical protein
MATIELKKEDEIIESKYRFSLRILIAFVKVLVILIAWLICANYTMLGYNFAKTYVTETFLDAKYSLYDRLDLVEKQPIIAQKDRVKDFSTIGQLAQKIALRYKISPVILLAMVDQESSFNPNRIRFESKWKQQYRSKWPQNNMTDIEYNLLFSSIGIMQIGYGLHKDFCGLDSYVDLFDVETNMSCAAKIIRACLNKNADMRPGKRVRTCVKEFNGSGAAADKYVTSVMARIDDFLIENSKEKIIAD